MRRSFLRHAGSLTLASNLLVATRSTLVISCTRSASWYTGAIKIVDIRRDDKPPGSICHEETVLATGCHRPYPYNLYYLSPLSRLLHLQSDDALCRLRLAVSL